jgi:hypothetical protein
MMIMMIIHFNLFICRLNDTSIYRKARTETQIQNEKTALMMMIMMIIRFILFMCRLKDTSTYPKANTETQIQHEKQ